MGEEHTGGWSETLDVVVLAAREDDQRARAVVNWLEDAGLAVWWAVDDLQLGLAWSPQVALAMERATLIVVVVSPDTAASLVPDEVAHACQEGFALVPVFVAGGEGHRHEMLFPGLNRVQSFDLKPLFEADGTVRSGAGDVAWAELRRFVNRVADQCRGQRDEGPAEDPQLGGHPRAQAPREGGPEAAGAKDGLLAAAVFALFVLTVIVAVIVDATPGGGAG